MAKINKTQVQALLSVLQHAERANRYISDTRTAVCMVKERATTRLDYQRSDGRALCEVAKDIGSDLTGLPEAIRLLKDFINSHKNSTRGE